MTRRAEIYDYIVEHKIKHDGNSPTVRAIMAACDISTTSVVKYHLGKLADQGYITIINRRIEVTSGQWVLKNT